jgi:Ca2+-binding RTX toxin-like protein
MKRQTTVAALAATLTAGFAANAVPAQAAATSATIKDDIATLNLDGADDNVTVSVAGGVLVHGQTTGGLHSGIDWNSAQDGDQTVPADGTFTVVVNGGAGNDTLTVLAQKTEIASATLNGEVGDDILTGADSQDGLAGGDGNDRLVGAKGDDKMAGGNGNDTLVWNNGDGSDTINGDAGNDATEVNGNATLGDTFTIAVNAGRIQFKRTNLVNFTLDSSTERLEVNGLGGNDSLSSSDGVGALTLLSVDGGAGNDTLTGSDGADVIKGGEADDVLTGGGGDDRISGDRGTDTMNGGTGDDTLVWNNGDGTDTVNGDAGRDDVEVNGAQAAGDVFSVQPNGERIKFDRTNLVPFSLDIGSSETMHANGLGGDDTITVGNVGSYSVTAAGGAGNDALTGGDASDTLLGGSGDDTIAAGGGIDVVSGDDGNDHVDVRDRTSDVALGGDGTDSVVADNRSLDIVDGFESVDRTPDPVVVPGPHATGRGVKIRGGVAKVNASKRTVAITVDRAADASSNGSGTVTLVTAKRVKLGGVKVTLQLGSARYSVAPGGSATVNVKLAAGVRRIADRKGHIAVRAIASTRDSDGLASNAKTLTVSLGKKGK